VSELYYTHHQADAQKLWGQSIMMLQASEKY